VQICQNAQRPLTGNRKTANKFLIIQRSENNLSIVGKYHAAVLTNDERWENYCVQAGLSSGDHAYPIIYCPEFQFTEFASYVADMKNSVNDRMNAQTSCAGIFIHSHLENGFEYPGEKIA
jgi:leucyl aminopeptidase